MTPSGPLADRGISEREAEVLELVGQRLTNAQIASRLYLSVRTVESHVSSLLRKLGATDRRALAGLADAHVGTAVSTARLPTQLTSFIGRAAERETLAAALGEHRLVTAIGPGGVGKTRLALAVSEDVRGRYRDDVRYVDLVPVPHPSMVGAALAGACGFGEQPGRSPVDTVIAKLVDAEVLVVLDNCEHLLEAVSTLVERLLVGCPGVAVLATSRARLGVPFEFVFPVPGLSLEGGHGPGNDVSDAAALFWARAAMTGWASPYADDRRVIASVCRRLDGMALAIELAAARVATLGLDGLVSGLTDPLELLTGGSRVSERHRSLRAVLDWSSRLLAEDEHAVLRRASVFAASFPASWATAVVGFAPVSEEDVTRVLARLADQNLVTVLGGPTGTRYRLLETIRQYGAELMDGAGELDDVRGRYMRWCLARAEHLAAGDESHGGFDDVADDLRAALAWGVDHRGQHGHAHHLAGRLAGLTYTRGKLTESQERYEQMAACATAPADAAQALHLGATVAWGRHAGNEAVRLFLAAADAARRDRDLRRAALELVNAAEVITNAPGILSELLPHSEARALLGEARALASGDVHVEAAVLTVTTPADEFDPAYADLAERAVELAHRVGDKRLESHALDQLTASSLISSELDRAVAAVRRRLELLAPGADDAELAWEFTDVLHMAPMVYLAVGDLATARRYAAQRSALPVFRESDHLAVEWLLTTAAVAGDFDEAAALAERFRRGWLEAGRPPLGGIGFAPAAAAMVHGIRGDLERRRQWLDVFDDMVRVVERRRAGQRIYRPAFEGWVALHHGDLDLALSLTQAAPESFKPWHDAAWRPWYAAVWAEAGVLAGTPDRRDRLDRARFLVRGNAVAAALVERAVALESDRTGLLAVAARLGEAGCPYQRARTLVLAGGRAAMEGRETLAALGAAPMAEVRTPSP